MTICHQLDVIPDLLAVHAHKPDYYPYLLASNTSGNQNSRFSLLMAYPQELIRQSGSVDDCLQSIDIDPCQQTSDNPLPFVGGWFVFLAYEYARSIEPRVDYFEDNSGMPVAFRARVPAAIIIDHANDESWIMVEEQFPELVEKIATDLDQAEPYAGNDLEAGTISEDDPQVYLDHISRTKQYIPK